MFLNLLFKIQLEVILAARALGLGRSWWTVTSQIATLANFYLSTWEEYHTGSLIGVVVTSMTLIQSIISRTTLS